MTNPYQAVALAIDEAGRLLAAGDARKALARLENLAKEDIRGIFTGYPAYYRILAQCREALGMDSRNEQNRLSELELGWSKALALGWEALSAGDAEKSVTYFRRSLNANPDEAGTAGGIYEALRGMAKAYLRMGMEQEAKKCLDQLKRRRKIR